MGSLFNLDAPIWSFMGKVADLVVINLLVVVCSLPIFTIGAAWTALYYVVMRMVRKEEGYIIKDFFRSFKENFKQATVIWLIFLAIIMIIVGDVYIYVMVPGQIPGVIMTIVGILGCVVMGTLIYVFPMLARYSNTIKNTIKNAFVLSIANIPFTLIFIALMISPVVLAVYVMELFPMLMVVGISLPAYLIGLMLVRIFRKLEPAQVVTESDNETEEMEL